MEGLKGLLPMLPSQGESLNTNLKILKAPINVITNITITIITFIIMTITISIVMMHLPY